MEIEVKFGLCNRLQTIIGFSLIIIKIQLM